MIDPKKIRDEFVFVEQRLCLRGMSEKILSEYKVLDQQWREALQEIESLKQVRNQAVPKEKPTSQQQIHLKALSDEIKHKEEALVPLETRIKDIALQLPNIPHESVPVGQSEEDNVEVKRVGEPCLFDFTVLSHEQIGKKWGVMDFENAAKIAGSRFVVMRKWGAKLERALIQWMLDCHTQKHGYEEVLPPAIVNSKSLFGTGQLPKFSEDLFQLKDTGYWLSPTSEVQLTNLYADTVLLEEQLPICITGVTPCFRSEAGSSGKDTAGIIRLHQFHKVELVQLVHPDRSMEALDTLRAHAEFLLTQLGLPYRVMALCTGDLGFCSAKTYDLEVWMPSQKKYREISSCSNFLDFQSRRAMIRCKGSDSGKTGYLHTLNGSALAVGRTLAAILENYQQKDGAVIVPDVLVPWMGVERLA